MASKDDPLSGLLEALEFSPDNVPLRRHVAEALASAGRLEEAERHYREVIKRVPDDDPARLGLAEVFYRQKKHSAAAVLIEQLISGSPPGAAPGRVYLLHMQLLLEDNKVDQARRAYQRAIEADPSLDDQQLREQFSTPQAADETGAEPTSDAGSVARLERPRITFADVGGMETIKEEVRLKIIHPLKHPELYKAYGKAIGGGILMYGPPGCGKTYLARATAGEVGAGFIAVGISDVLNMWLGNSEKNMHEVFQAARRNTPCVLFFDEVDALGANRTDLRQAAGRNVINQFLDELDGAKNSNDGVLILAATNVPWHLDPAFRRPGRFDRILFVPPPDTSARAEIIRVLCKGKPLDRIDYDTVARKTEGLSGADLKAVLDVAVEGKLREAMKTGVPAPLKTADLVTAAKAVKASTAEWFATAKNYAVFSNQGGAYDDILKYLKLG